MSVKREISVDRRHYRVDAPDECPICHHHSEIPIVAAERCEQGLSVQVVYRCAYAGCRSFFIGYYGPPDSSTLKTLRPMFPDVGKLPDTVGQVSPRFVEVFREAEEAAHLGLTQVAGPGYRKAFEFLIKDYAKTLAPHRTDDIESEFSGVVVNEYVADTRIQAVAKRCLWLGNDASHYLKKWVEHDILDLVSLIRLTAAWIEIDRLSKSYIDEMPD